MDISSSIMPDLAKITEESKKKKQTAKPVASFRYDNTVEETNGSLKCYQKMFSKKRGVISIIAYSLLLVAVVVGIVLNPKNVLAYLALAFCLFGLIFAITDKQRTRKKILKTLDDMDPEDYCCTIYPDKIEIETTIRPKNGKKEAENELTELISEAGETGESGETGETGGTDQNIAPIKTVYVFGLDMLDLAENDQSLILFYNRRLVYCFPKRCLGEDVDRIREFLTEKIYYDRQGSELV